MQELDEHDYFERRALEERTAAAKATDERAAQSHRDLAQCYERKAHNDAQADDGAPEPVSTMIPGEGFRIIP